MRWTSLAAAAALAPAAACGSIFDANGCATQAVPGIVLEVRDPVTNGAPPSAVTGGALPHSLARDGGYVDTGIVTAAGRTQPPSVALAYERAGTYELTVTAPGYRPWQRAGVRVTRGECHVRTEHVTALLQRLP